MKRIIQVHIYKGEKYYVAECADLAVVTQAKSLDELVKNLKEAIKLHLEGEDLKDLGLAPSLSVLANFEIGTEIYAQA